jgi:hypothetical protein
MLVTFSLAVQFVVGVVPSNENLGMSSSMQCII